MNSDNSPHVTVCIPAYNAAKTISRTIDSILTQDYPNYDVLVSDNFSSDDTFRIVESYKERCVCCFLNPDQKTWNASENFNHALSLASGPLIALYHADDLYTPTMLRRQVEFLQKEPHATAVFTMSQIIDEKDRPVRMSNFTLPKEYQGKDIFSFPDLFNAFLKYGTITVVPTMMTRKSVLENVGNFNWQQFCDAADIDLYLRMAQIGPIGIIDESLHKYRISPNKNGAYFEKTRTHPTYMFLTLDYWLSIPEVQKIVEPNALFRYEIRRSSDDIIRAKNMFTMRKYPEAYTLLKSIVSRRAFKAGLKKRSFGYQFLLGLLLLIALRTGLGNISHYLYTQYYKPFREKNIYKPINY